MSEPAASGQPPGDPNDRLLASDADRARYADRLGDAFAEGRLTREEYEERLTATMSGRTYGDLKDVLADLPGAGTLVPLSQSLPSVRHSDVSARDGWLVPANTPADLGAISSNAIAIFGGSTKKGQWVVAEELNAVAIFGGVELDFTSAYFAAPTVKIRAVAIFGGIEITVPEGLTVHVEGVGIFGGFDQKAEGPGDVGAPVLRVEGVAIFGGVEVKRARRMLPPGSARPAVP